MLQSLAFKNLLMTKLHLFLRHVLYADVTTLMRGIHIGSLSHDLWRFMISNTFCLFVPLPWWRDGNQYWMRTISFHKSLLRFFFITCLLNPAFSWNYLLNWLPFRCNSSYYIISLFNNVSNSSWCHHSAISKM